MIEMKDVSKSYGGRPVVDGVSLTVAKGDFCVLIGPSGCGKSTTLRMINRLVSPTKGSVRVGGEDVMQVPVEALRRRIGYAIQSIGLFPHWTVEDNIATVPRLLRWPRARVRDRVVELLELLRLDPEEYRSKYPHQLSGGQQQRVGVARALAADPGVLLMDEPFGALDPLTRDVLQVELAGIHKAMCKTIIFVTHDIDEALRLASSIAIMHQGRIIQFGPPLEILERPANDFVRDFVGRWDIGLKLLTVRKVADRLRHGELTEGEPIDAQLPLRDALSQMIARRTDRLPASRHGRPRRSGAVTVRLTVLRFWPLARRLLGSPILWVALLLAALVLLMPSLRPAFAWAFPGIEPSVYERESFLVLLFSQAALVGASSLVSTVAGVGLAVFVTRPAGRDFRAIANALAAIGQTFPPAAVLAIAVPMAGFGSLPTLIALILYGLLPIIENAIAGLEGVPRPVREAAEGIGLSPLQVLRDIELPLAAPIIVAGIRTSVIINIGTATIGSTVGAVTLGTPIIHGLVTGKLPYVLQGAAVVGLFAILTDMVFERLDRHLRLATEH